uniref:Uncharacterized protein n=1 Tax=Pararge aegeria TaxID=116150 RepID=S4NHP4_9NEOP
MEEFVWRRRNKLTDSRHIYGFVRIFVNITARYCTYERNLHSNPVFKYWLGFVFHILMIFILRSVNYYYHYNIYY